MHTRISVILLALLSLFFSGTSFSSENIQIMSTDDLPGLGHPAPDTKITYGNDPLQFVELRLPAGSGPHPVIILIHGGCWLADYDISYIGKLAKAFADEGIASWAPEYRRVGNAGGNWPGMFQDIIKSTDLIHEVAEKYQLDTNNVVASGHSAGGQLALWLAARQKFSNNQLFQSQKPLMVKGVLALAPAPDLEKLHENAVCGNVIDKLMGGSPKVQAERYAIASPMNLIPIGIPQALVIGSHDNNWKPGGYRYFELARKSGDKVSLLEAGESGHFEMIDPDSTTWPMVLDAARHLLGK